MSRERRPPAELPNLSNPYSLPPKIAILSPFLEPKEKQGIDLKP